LWQPELEDVDSDSCWITLNTGVGNGLVERTGDCKHCGDPLDAQVCAHGRIFPKLDEMVLGKVDGLVESDLWLYYPARRS